MQGILEGLLFISGDEGITFNEVKKVLEIDDEKLNYLINLLNEEYSSDKHGIILEKSGDTLKLVTKLEYKEYYKKIVDIDSDCDIQSTFNCIVKEVAFINKYNVVISNDKFDFHYLNLDLTNLQVGELININQKVGVVKKGGKLYFYVTKDGKRLKLTIKNQRVMFSEN